MTLAATLLGTGSPIPAADRAGPSTLVSFADEHYLVDAGRGVLMRLAAAGLGAANLSAVLLTHLHSDHITDLNDVITTRWITTFAPSPLVVVGPAGTRVHVDQLLTSLELDIRYRVEHHPDLSGPPPVDVIEVTGGPVDLGRHVGVSCAPTDHRPVEPSVGYRFDHDGRSIVIAGDTVPCDGLDRLATDADIIVHTVIRKDLIERAPIQRLRDTLDYHSSPEQAGETAARAGVGTLILTHCVPPIPAGGEHEWIALAASTFAGEVVVGSDLQRFEATTSHPRGT